MRICAKHYQGKSDLFLNSKKASVMAQRLSEKKKRVRSANTRFSSLGVPVGAKLTFTKNHSLHCIVLDDTNKVEYEGSAWSLSPLANNLLGVYSANGFCHFSYEGETLWDRRVRLETRGLLGECVSNNSEQDASMDMDVHKKINNSGENPFDAHRDLLPILSPCLVNSVKLAIDNIKSEHRDIEVFTVRRNDGIALCAYVDRKRFGNFILFGKDKTLRAYINPENRDMYGATMKDDGNRFFVLSASAFNVISTVNLCAIVMDALLNRADLHDLVSNASL